jgi:hypothetical protein
MQSKKVIVWHFLLGKMSPLKKGKFSFLLEPISSLHPKALPASVERQVGGRL